MPRRRTTLIAALVVMLGLPQPFAAAESDVIEVEQIVDAAGRDTFPQGTQQRTATIEGQFLPGIDLGPDAAEPSATFSRDGQPATGIVATYNTHSVDAVTVKVSVSDDTDPGRYDLTVEQAGESETCADCLRVSPIIFSVSPQTVAPGGQVTVRGEGFHPDARVSLERTNVGFDDSEGPFTIGINESSVAPDEVIGTVPASLDGSPAGAWDLVLENGDGGTASVAEGVTIELPEPEVTEVAPAIGRVGEATPRTLTVRGTHLTPASIVEFGEPAVVQSGALDWISSSLVRIPVEVGDAATDGSFDVTLTDGAERSVTCAACLKIGAEVRDLDPAQLGQGATDVLVAAHGVGLHGDIDSGHVSVGQVDHDGFDPSVGVVVSSVEVVDGTQMNLALDVAEGAATGDLALRVVDPAHGGASYCDRCITLTSAPSPTSISPSAVAAGSSRTVTIDGAGFQNGASVAFGHDVAVTSVSSTNEGRVRARITVARSAGIGDRTVSVTNPDHGVGTCACFEVAPPPPEPPPEPPAVGEPPRQERKSIVEPATSSSAPMNSQSTPDGRGYWIATDEGDVFGFGNAESFGSLRGAVATANIGAPVVDLTVTADGDGYWLLDDQGGVFTFGEAPFFGSLPGRVQQGIVGPAEVTDMARTPSGEGYVILDHVGGVHTFGDAEYHGSIPGLRAEGQEIGRTRFVSIAATPDGGGYWILDRNGGVFTFGNAEYFDSIPGLRAAGVPIGQTTFVSLAPTSDGRGYWIVDRHGGVFTFGNAEFHGSIPGLKRDGHNIGNAATAAIEPAPGGEGYWIFDEVGGVFTFGSARFAGSVPGLGRG